MEISRRQAGDFIDVRVKGRLDGYWADHLTRALEQVVREGCHHIRVNLAEVTYISSIGIRVLVYFYQQLQGIQGVFVVASPSEPVKKVLDLARLGELLMPEAVPSAASQTMEIPRTLERAAATFEVRRLAPAPPLTCRVTGDPELLIGCRFAEQHSRTTLFPDSTLGLGLGAFGNSFEDCRGRFGEFLALAGAAAYLPTDGSNVPDYLLAEGAFVPEVQVLYSIACEGSFAYLARFEAAGVAAAVALPELVDACLEIAGAPTVAIALVAESAGLIGAALRRSPAGEPSDAAPFRHPEVRRWLSFSAERSHTRSLAVVAGVASRSPERPLEPLLRPVGKAAGHFHAAAFSYRPLKKGRIELHSTVKSLFGAETLQGVLHLLGDDRGAAGARESEFVRGACWVGPISQITSERTASP